ncbi:hypothetical protein HYALB_00008692 [Hymenoscyphus albidus]|uniref:2EXR domain-containing protein n=1 Tax=Hymenoscyphus albidus TaxID=595503 RepID=A0A9N9LNH8_9HELO|nr:hypothetical protein HYALB_00008692 [Hymenoscyphus albidus]
MSSNLPTSNATMLNNDNTPTTTTSSPPTFHLFPRLPAELRIKVWKFVDADGRIVSVTNVYHPNEWLVNARNYVPSSLLSTNHESRTIYLKQPAHPLTIRVKDHHKFAENGAGVSFPKAYFNPEVDTLYIPEETTYLWYRHSKLKLFEFPYQLSQYLKHLACGWATWTMIRHWIEVRSWRNREENWNTRKEFPVLGDVLVVVNDKIEWIKDTLTGEIVLKDLSNDHIVKMKRGMVSDRRFDDLYGIKEDNGSVLGQYERFFGVPPRLMVVEGRYPDDE